MLFKGVFLLIALIAVFVQSTPLYEDSEIAASGDHHGRVQIKVYRGPTEHHGHHDDFAPWGFWVKQPADDDGHH